MNDTNRIAPSGWHSVTPRLVAHHARELVEFVREVFDAAGAYQAVAPSILEIGDSKVMISEAGERAGATAFLYVYVADAAATYRRALAHGAVSLEAPKDTPYGDRRCMVQDRWGNTWQIATPPAGIATTDP